MIDQQLDVKIVILKKGNFNLNLKNNGNFIVLQFESNNLFHMILSIYHLATSKWVIIDNYFGSLAPITFKTDVTCVQVWHAAGAIKQFGLRDPSIARRTPGANKRFLQVYQKFNYCITGSERMGEIFKECFNLDDANILRTGIPRTDFFFNNSAQAAAYQKLNKKYPKVIEKKTILYAPTFRDSANNIELDIEMLYNEFHTDNYVLLLRLHPSINNKFENEKKYENFLYDLSDYPDINHLLLLTDILVTDYSSIPFEFSFLQKPIIFFAYDLEAYKQERGFFEDYLTSMPGPIVTTTYDLVNEIKQLKIDLTQIENFKNKWNEYSYGESSKNFVDSLFNQEAKQIFQEVNRPVNM